MTSLQQRGAKIICQTVCDWWDLPQECIRDRSRQENVVVARHFACLLMRTLLGALMVDINRIINRRSDHTPRNSIRHAQDLIDAHPKLKSAYDAIEKECRRRLGL